MDKNLHILINLDKTVKEIREEINRHLRKLNSPITYDRWLILQAIYDTQGINQKQLSLMIGKDTGALSRMIKQMDNYIVKKSGYNSPHEVCLYLEPEGFEICKKLNEEIADILHKRFALLHDKEANLLLEWSKRLQTQ